MPKTVPRPLLRVLETMTSASPKVPRIALRCTSVDWRWHMWASLGMPKTRLGPSTGHPSLLGLSLRPRETVLGRYLKQMHNLSEHDIKILQNLY